MANDERRIGTWDILRGVLSVGSLLLAGLASFSARMVVERSDAQDKELERRIVALEAQLAVGILPRSDERIRQIQRDIERLEAELRSR